MSTLNWTRKLSPFASSRLTYSIDDQTGIVTSQIHEDELGDLLRAAGYQLDDSDGPLRIDGTWLVREVEGCNCNGGDAASNGTHEPHCGLQPELNLAAVDGFQQLGQYLDQRLADEAAALRSALVANGSTPCKCGHPQGLHIDLTGSCKEWRGYPEVLNPRQCGCDNYRPDHA